MQIPIAPGIMFTIPKEWSELYTQPCYSTNKNGYISQTARENARKKRKKKK